MSTDAPNGSTRHKLRAALAAVGLDASDDRVDTLLPAYEAMLTGAARLRELDLGATEPATVFRLPRPE